MSYVIAVVTFASQLVACTSSQRVKHSNWFPQRRYHLMPVQQTFTVSSTSNDYVTNWNRFSISFVTCWNHIHHCQSHLNWVQEIRRHRKYHCFIKDDVSFAATLCARSLLGNFSIVLQQIDLRDGKRKENLWRCLNISKDLKNQEIENLNLLRFAFSAKELWSWKPQRDIQWKSLIENLETISKESGIYAWTWMFRRKAFHLSTDIKMKDESCSGKSLSIRASEIINFSSIS